MSMVTGPELIIGRVMSLVSTCGHKMNDVHKKPTRFRHLQNGQVILLYENNV